MLTARAFSRTFILTVPLSFCFSCTPNEGGPPLTETSARGLCLTSGPNACDATPRLDLSTTLFIGQPFPTTMDPGEKLPVSAVMQNTGPVAWSTTGSNHIIRFQASSAATIGGANHIDIPATPVSQSTVPVGATRAFVFPDGILAPDTPGTYDFIYGMRDGGTAANGPFGTLFSTQITVAARQRAFDCQVVSTNVPPRLGTGRGFGAQFTVRNTGTATWIAPPTPTSGLGMRLCQNDDGVFSGPNCVNVTTNVPPNGTYTFNWTITPPPLSPGNTEETWTLVREMKDQRVGGIQFFRDFPLDACIVQDVIDQLCGDNLPGDDPTEECDDGNTLNGDGCDDRCRIENPRIVDLSVTGGDRTIMGRTLNKALGNVVYGNVVGDNLIDVCVGDTDHVGVPNTTPVRSRNVAGRVTCYDGAGFFAGADVVVPTGSALEVIGANVGDHVGGSSSGRIVIGDVTTDGRPDLLVSAPFADGPGETRTDCGEVYIIPNTMGLGGTLDLAAPPANVTTIYGPAAGDNLRILAFGDMDGDGARDLIIGAALNDVVGTDAGAIYIVQGGAALQNGGTIDLATTAPYATFLATAPGDTLGFVATVGDVIGTTFRDLVFSSAVSDFSGRNGTGITYVFAGPIAAGTYDVTTQFDLRITGANDAERYGQSMTIGNVKGADTRQDLVLGVPGALDAGGVRVGRVDVWTGPITIPANRTIDTAVTTANTQIWGVDDDDRWGSSVAVGHWNNDHRVDIAISGSAADGPGNTRDGCGEMVLVLGHENLQSQLFLSAATPLHVYGQQARDLLGAHVLNLAFGADLDANDSSQRFDLCVGDYRGGALREGRVDCFQAP